MLDTDIPLNDPADRPITGMLYVRGREMRLCQEIVLGIGGVRALRALGIPPAVWHMNEGHVAFLGLERARERVRRGDGLERGPDGGGPATRSSPRTPRCPRATRRFDRELVRRYLGPWIHEVGCDPEAALALGADNGHFNLTVLAIRLSSRVERREPAARRRSPPPCGATSGRTRPSSPSPPSPTACTPRAGSAPRCARSTRSHLRPATGRSTSSSRELWAHVAEIPDAELWAAHRSQKERLIRFVRERVRQQSARATASRPTSCARWRACSTRAPSPSASRAASPPTSARCSCCPTWTGCARCCSTPSGRCRSIFAGKAHPADREGQDVIRQLFLLTQGEFRGKLVFLEDYDMEVGRMLVQGCDVWLNTPRRPQEASGTSGQKCADQRRRQPEHPRRLVGRGLPRRQRLGHRRRDRSPRTRGAGPRGRGVALPAARGGGGAALLRPRRGRPAPRAGSRP